MVGYEHISAISLSNKLRTEPVDRRTSFNGASVRGLRYARLAGTVLPAEKTISLETLLTGSNLLFAQNALRRHRECIDRGLKNF